MDFDFSPEQYTLRDEAARFLQSQCPPAHVREFIDDEAGWSRALWKQMADLGWMGIAFPERYGGLGRSFDDLALLLGELGRVLAPVPFLSGVLAGTAVLQYGSERQKRALLPAIASGDRIAALAVAGGSFDPQPVVARRDGDTWRLTGDLPVVLDAPAADLFLVAGRTSKRAERWFVVSDGATVRPEAAFDRTRPAGAVRFDDVPAEPLAKGGIEQTMIAAWSAVCAEMVGTAQQILDASVAYSKDREQFGRPIGSFQAIKHKAADMLTSLEAARSAAFYACWAVASGAEDASVAASVAKSFCSEALAALAGEGVQIHGGIAFTWEHDMHLYLRRIKSDEALFGDAAFHRERIARLIGL